MGEAPALPPQAALPQAALPQAALPPAPEAPLPLPAAAQAAAAVLPPAGAQAPAPAAAPAQASAFRTLYDGAALPKPPDGLLVLAAPFRTEVQLAKLAARPRPAGESFGFTVLGDSEPGRFWHSRRLFNKPGVFWKQLRDSLRRDADFTVQLGDMVSRGSWRNFLAFFLRLAGLAPKMTDRPYLTVIGNHDRRRPHGRSDSRNYRSLFGGTDYHFDHAGVRFVTVDSSSGRVTREQLRWLDRVLDTPLRTVVFTHVPPAVLWDWPGLGSVVAMGGFRRGARAFVDLLERRGVARAYMGHIHTLGAFSRGPTKYVLTGGGGSPLYPLPVANLFHHYLTVRVSPDSITETVHLPDGTSAPLL